MRTGTRAERCAFGVVLATPVLVAAVSVAMFGPTTGVLAALAGTAACVAYLRAVEPASELVLSYRTVDVETTGLDPDIDRIVQIAVTSREPSGDSTESWLVRPVDGRHGAEEVHGISVADLLDAPTFAEVAEQVSEALGDGWCFAHNAAFDFAFIDAELARLSRPPASQRVTVVCTARLAVTAGLRPATLAAVCDQLTVAGPYRAHTAGADAEACARIAPGLLERLGINSEASLADGILDS